MSINQSSAAVLASASTQGFSSSPTVLTVELGHGLEIPGGNFLLTADFHRVGGDLLLVGKDGHEVVVRDYFSSHNPPDLISGSGGVIHSDLAARLAGAIAPGQWAQDGAPQSQLHAIGEIQKLSGVVKVHHVDGTVETLQQGATVFQGDVLETAGDGSVGIVFADRSTFSLGKNGRMVMDELVYDPQAHTGHSTMSVVQGTFSFVSGQIAKSAPDAMSVKTPVMTIGIRGTTVAGTAAAEGSQNTIALLSDDDGGVGQIVVATQGGPPQVMTQPNQAIQMSSAFQAPPTPVVMPPAQLHQLMPDLHNVQENRPPQPTSDPHINTSATSGNSTAQPASGPQGQNGEKPAASGEKPAASGEKPAATAEKPAGEQPAAAAAPAPAATEAAAPAPAPATTTTVDPAVAAAAANAAGGTLSIPTASVLDQTAQQTQQVVVASASQALTASTQAATTTSTTSSSTQTNSSSSSNSTTNTTATVVTPTVTHTETLNTNTSSNSTVASTITGSDGTYVLSGGNAETVYTESQQGTGLLAHNNWTILANGNAATVDLYELPSNYSSDDHLGTVVLYANTQASPDSSAPTLSLHNDSHGATIDLTASTANLAHVHSNGYLKDTTAQGFHHIVGSSGDDQFNYTAGLNLSLDGGGGVDTLSLHGATTVNLTSTAMTDTGILSALNIETIVGSTGADLFLMGSGTETIDGGYGQNTIDFHTQTTGVLVQLNGFGLGTASGQGIATDLFRNIEIVAGSSGNDTIIGDALSDSLYGGVGNDTLIGGAGTAILDGGLGNDTLIGGASHATMLGGSGNDLLIAGTANSTLDGGAGVDTLDLSAESSYVTVVMNGNGAGTAYVDGGPTDVFYNIEVVIAGDHGGTLIADNQGDTLLGGTGGDWFIGGTGNDYLDGRGNSGDTLDYHAQASNLTVVLNGASAGTATGAGIGTDTLFNLENLLGGSGNDFLSGGTSTSSLSIMGGAGNDTLRGGAGNDLLDGGIGANTLDYSNSTAGLYVHLGGTAIGTAVGTDIGHDALYNFEILVGGRGNDTLVADNLGDSLYGGSGNDTLIGGGGNDSLYGGAGNDTIVAGVGSDTMDGGAGVDVLSYQGVSSSVTLVLTNAALTTGLATDTSAGTDSLSNFEVIVGSSYADSIQLLSRDDQLLTGSVTLDGGAGQDSLFADTASNLTITLTGTTGTMTSGDGGSVSFVNFEKIAGGIGADVIQDVSGTAALSGSWFSQSDADAMSAAAVAGTAVKDATGPTQLAAGNLQDVNGNAHYLAYLSGGEVYREIWNGSAQTPLQMTPLGGAVTSFDLSENGREALYTDASALYFYDADNNKAHQVGSSGSYAYNASYSTAHAMSADGHLVAYIDSYQSQNGTYGLVLVNTRTGNVVSETSLGTTAVSQLAFAADGKDVFALNSSGVLSSMVLSDDGAVVGGTVQLQTGVTSFQVEADGQGYIYSTSAGVNYSSTRNGVGSLLLTSSSTDAAISANGRFVSYWITDGSTSTAMLYDTTSKTKVSLAPVSGDQHSNSLSFSDDGHYLFLSTSSGVISEVNPYFSSSTSDLNTLIGGSHNDTLLGGLDVASGALESVNTTTMSVTLNAGNTLIAGSGNQTLVGNGGSDVFKLQSSSLGHVAVIGGGVGDNQVLDLSAVTANLFVDLRNTMLDPTEHQLLLKDSSGNILASDSVSGVSNAIGGSGAASTLVGNQNANTLVAGSGASTTFVGHGGADQIFFGAHTNMMILTQDYHADTVYLDNVAGAVNLLSADGQVGLNAAARSGNDLILSFNDAGGGGQTVFKDYYVDTNDTLQIFEDGALGGIFVKNGVQEGISLIGAMNSTASMYVMTGTSADDMLVGTTDNMLFLGSASAILGSDTSKGDDFFLYGRNNVVIGSSGTGDSGGTVYYADTTAALAGHGITANLSAYYAETISDGTHTGSTNNVNLVFGYNSTDYLVNVDEISGTNNGDTFIGGRYAAVGNRHNNVDYQAGHGNNVIVNAGIGSTMFNGELIGVFSDFGTYYATTGVLADYSNSSTGITANLNHLENLETIVVSTGAAGAILETVMLTGTVVHDSIHTDLLYGVFDIRGSAHSDVITASSFGSYIRSSLGNDTYIASSGYNTLDYSDATGGLFVSFSSTAHTVSWTFADGFYTSFVLQSVGTTAYAMHDYKQGSGFTDVLEYASGGFNDIRMSYDGGVIIGTGWQDSSGITMDLQDLSQNNSGAVITMAGSGAFSTVTGWNGTSSILFQDVEAIKGTGQNDTFILSATSNPLSLIGGGGSDTVSLAKVGWHSWYSNFVSGTDDTVYLTSQGTSVALSGISAIAREISLTSGNKLLLNSVGGESANSATVYLDAGEVYWSDAKWMSVNGTFANLTSGGTLFGATGGDLIVGSLSDFTSMSRLDGNSSNATLELTDSVLSTMQDFSSMTNLHNIEVLQLDGTVSSGIIIGSPMTKLQMDVYSLTNSTGSFSSDLGSTLYLGGGDHSSVLTLGDAQLLNGSVSKLSGFSDIAIGAFTYHNGTGATYTPDSVVASLGTAALQDGIHTLDLSSFAGASWVTLSGYSGSSLTVIGGSGIDMFSFDLSASQLATYVLQGDGSDILNEHSYSYGNSNLEMHATVDINGYAVLYNSPSLKNLDSYNAEIVLKGVDLVRFSDHEDLVMGTATRTAALDVALGETITYLLAATGVEGTFTAQATEGMQTVIFDGYTAYLSVGYDPGYDSANTVTGTGDELAGTAVLTAAASLTFGSHLNLDLVSATSHDVVDAAGYGFTADGADLRLLALAGTSMAMGDSMTLVANMLNDGGSFAHITGLDGYAARGLALSLDFNATSIGLTAHSAVMTTSSYLAGSTGTDYILGGHGDQTLSGGGGADEILAVSGNDTVILGDNRFAYADGGSGSSKLSFAFGSASTIDLTGTGQVTATSTGGQHRADSVEHFDALDLTSSSGSTLVMNESSVYSAANASNAKLLAAGVSAANASHALIIGGTGGDVLDLTHTSTAWTTGSTVNLTVDGSSHSYQVYTSNFHGTAESVYVDTHVSVVKS